MPHIHDLIDFTVGGYIVNSGRVALVHHRQLKRWLPVGGHIELNEDAEEALFREIEEEAGISRHDLTLLSKKPGVVSPGTKFLHTPNYFDIHHISETHRHVGIVYFLKSATDKLVLAPEEHFAIKWFRKKELDDSHLELSNAVKFYAKEAMHLVRKLDKAH